MTTARGASLLRFRNSIFSQDQERAASMPSATTMRDICVICCQFTEMFDKDWVTLPCYSRASRESQTLRSNFDVLLETAFTGSSVVIMLLAGDPALWNCYDKNVASLIFHMAARARERVAFVVNTDEWYKHDGLQMADSWHFADTAANRQRVTADLKA